jgi:outer membrane lipoprotein-sorting protein
MLLIFSTLVFALSTNVYSCWNPVQNLLKGKDLIISFDQKSYYKFLPRPKSSSGALMVSANGKFYWTLEGSNAGSVISNGSKVWIYTPAEDKDPATLMVRPAGNFFNPATVFNACFEDNLISYSSKESKTGTVNEVVFDTLDGNSYKWISVKYIQEPFRIINIEYEDSSGTKNVIKTKSFKYAKLPASVYSFKPPSGTRIIP